MELESGEGTVVVADRDRCCNDGCNRNSGWGSGYKTNSDIRDSRDQMGAGFNRVMDRLCNMSFEQQQCCCDIKNGQQEIKCLIENTAKDQEIARLNRVVDAQRDQNIIQSVVAALKTTTTTPA